MSKWETVKLGDICHKIGSGATPRGGKNAYKKTGTSLIRSQNILDFTFSYDGLAFIDEEQSKKLDNVTLVENDILLNITGDSVARVCAVPIEVLPARVNQHIAIIRCNKEKLDHNFLLYSLIYCKQILLSLASAGATRNALTKAMIENLEILLPPLDEQKRIASILSSLDDKIENNNRINKNLEEQAQAIFKSWFVDFEPFGGVMPSDWREGVLGDVCSLIVKGITPKYNEKSEQIVINQKCIRNNKINLQLTKRHTPKKITEKWLLFGDILINSTGTGTLGRSAQFFYEENNITVDSHITIIRPISLIFCYYLGIWSFLKEDHFVSLSTGSTGQTDLPREKLRNLQVIIPSNNTLNIFNKFITPLQSKIFFFQNENQKLAQLRDALLPKLMSGEVRV